MMDKKGDVSELEDTIQVLINLVSIEEHSINSFFSTSDNFYLELNELVRKMRSELMETIINNKGENWCISKHLLSSIMALREIGNRHYTAGDKEKAKSFYDKSGILLGLFLNINNPSMISMENGIFNNLKNMFK